MDQVQTLKDLPPPNDTQEILSFLGFIVFFRHWIPNFASLALPLYQAAKETPTGPLTYRSMVCGCFSSLRDTLLQAPALALPNPSKPYHLFTDETSGIAKGVLTQLSGTIHRPIAYISRQLDPTVRGWQPCLQALAMAATLTREALKLSQLQPITVYSPHRLADLLTHSSLSLIGDSCLHTFHLLFIDNPDITLTTCSPLNPTTLLPTPHQ
jgi:hypothetical protein